MNFWKLDFTDITEEMLFILTDYIKYLVGKLNYNPLAYFFIHRSYKKN